MTFFSRFLFVVSIIFIGITLLSKDYQFYRVNQNSMQNTLFTNDRLIVKKGPIKEVKINNILIVRHGNEIFVKRCVALPGNTISISNGKFIVNNKEADTIKIINAPVSTSVKENNFIYKNNKINNIQIYEEYGFYWTSLNFGPYIVPYKGMKIVLNRYNLILYRSIIESENTINYYKSIVRSKSISYIFKNDYYFVLGDNRLASIDSRFFGPVSKGDLIGTAIILLCPRGRWINYVSR